jgi:hypothetical protein
MEIDNESEQIRRLIRRPSKAEGFQPSGAARGGARLLSVELLRRAKWRYQGGKSALYE